MAVGNDVLEPWLAGSTNAQGEQRMYCPLCEDPTISKSPSASVNWSLRVWKCFSCRQGGSLAALIRSVAKGRRAKKPEYDPFPWYEADANGEVVSLDARRNGQGKVEHITEAKVLSYVRFLQKSPKHMAYLLEDRGLEPATIELHRLGYDEQLDRYTIPVYDADGALVNLRRYKRDADAGKKMLNATGHGSPPRLYPAQNLSAGELHVVEGEWDALLHTQQGWPSVTGTHGAATWDASWAASFVDKTVYLCYDNDKEGRIGMRRAGQSLAPVAKEVHVVTVPVEMNHGDLTDYWVGGGTRANYRTAMRNSELILPKSSTNGSVEVAGPTPVPVQVIGSMDSTTNGKPLLMHVTITGKRDPTYSVPHKAKLECTLDAGPKCKSCPMNTEHEGEVEIVIGPHEVGTLHKFIDATDSQVLDVLRKYIGAAKCTKFTANEVENQSIEELFVTGSIDRRGATEEADYTHRRIYNVGGHDTRTNTSAVVIGTTVPNRKDRRNEFFDWELRPAVTSLDKFTMTPEMHARLSVFQPVGRQRPIEKCREIAKDLSDNVTMIIGRERLHMAIDLVFHSVLHFPLDDKIISRGWLEFLVVGDTRTGKSETAIRLTEHYELGHVVGCEGATLAGLVGAVKQISEAWTVQWGEITINDRRLVVLDEASGLTTDIISQLSDIRSRGIAQLTKAQSGQTHARCRMVWISNPRKGRFVDEKKYDGIDVLEDLIGNPEDIARFDFAMSVSQNDVPNERINSPDRQRVPHVYTSELCRDLVLWVWSRRADQVRWETDAYQGVYKAAEWLGKRYVDSPPLIQRTNVREKVARLAVAVAARTFSTDETGEQVVVTLEHVKDAMYFLDELYAYDNFGYLRLSQRTQRNRKLAKKNRDSIRQWLKENPRLLDFLTDRRGSFRAQDLEEMAHMQRDEVNYCLSRLTDSKMISKSKSQIILEPELHDLLREMEGK